MGVEGLENIPDNPVDTPADDEVAEQIRQREDGEAERQAQDDQKLQDHKERQERMQDSEPIPPNPEG